MLENEEAVRSLQDLDVTLQLSQQAWRLTQQMTLQTNAMTQQTSAAARFWRSWGRIERANAGD